MNSAYFIVCARLQRAARRLTRFGLFFLALVAVAQPAAQAAERALVLNDAEPAVDVWPVITVFADAKKTLTLAQVQEDLSQFHAPGTSYATLGVRTEAIWLRIPFKTNQSTDGRWILDIAYPPINQLDVFVTAQGAIVRQAALGNLRNFESRPMQSRTHSLDLNLAPDMTYEIFVRAESGGALIMPVSLRKPAQFHAASVREQMLQGLLSGIALCLLLYSLVQWTSLRETLFLKYALLVTGSMMFSLLQFGIGTQYLWTNNFWMEQHAGGLFALTAMCGSFLFIGHTLIEPGKNRVFSKTMNGGALACAVLAVIYCLDIFNTRILTAVIAVVGPLPSVLGIPGAVGRVRRGDPIGIALLLAWIAYLVVTAIATGVIRGQVGANFWTLHAFQFGATFDMLAFMYVLGQRTKAIRLVAQRASVERDLMHSLAITDALTGLANRRGLRDALTEALSRSNASNLLAVYMIDVDGFKPVNDRYGHDTGDELLVNMSKRMRETVRSVDIVARLGGDEFVVVASGLRNTQDAHDLGTGLLRAFDSPFALKHHTVSVGLTIGYAIAPEDAADTTTLLQLADAAMYQGKQAGKHCLRRAVPSQGAASSVSAQAV